MGVGEPAWRRRPSVGGIALFVWIWGLTGFAMGTATLIGPVRWLTSAVRSRGGSQGEENAWVLAVIMALVLASAATALWLTVSTARTRLRHVRYGIPTLALAAAVASLWLWMTPEVMAESQGEPTEVGARFTFGPYPTESTMGRLVEEGYTAVVSLLHPAVVPFEPKLLADEKRAAAKVGLELIHLPMLPWISDNEETLRRAEELARSGTGRYYVHCYLGKDRVQLIRRVVEEHGVEGAVEGETESRSLEGAVFERGAVVTLGEGVFLTPYPTDEEFLAFFLSGRVGRVVSLMNPESADDRPWIERERELLASYEVPFEVVPLPGNGDPHAVLAAARRVRAMPPPLVVHAFLAPSTGKAPGAEAFVQAYRSDLPPLPPSALADPLRGGAVQGIAPNLAVGPRPAPAEFGARLGRAGVREFVYLGDPGDEAARVDGKICRDHEFAWRAAREGDDLEALVAGNGPWYLYGPGLARVRPSLATALGPAVPARITPAVAAALGRRSRETPDEPPETAAVPVVEPAAEPAAAAERFAAFLVRSLPAPTTAVLLGPPLLLGAALAGGFAGWLRTRGVRAPFTRKTFHFLIFTAAGALHITAGLPAVMLFGGIVSVVVLYAVWRGDGFPLYEAMARPSDAPRRSLFIVVPLFTTALGGLLVNLFFAPFAYVGYLVGGWGDAIGEPVGAAWGRHPYRVPSIGGVRATRTLEGSTAVIVVGTLAALLGLWAAGVDPTAAWIAALACGLGGAAVEAVSHHGTDNLTIQLAAAGIAYAVLA